MAIQTINEIEIHLHCVSCYSNHCHVFLSCSIIYCPNQCGVQFHKCKINEHLLVCRRQVRSCINVIYGCPFQLNADELMNHLHHCPASVLQCSVSWNRKPLFFQDHNVTSTKLLNPVAVKGHLDTEFALSDQKYVNQEIKYCMYKGSKKKENPRAVSKIAVERLLHLETLMASTHTKSYTVKQLTDNTTKLSNLKTTRHDREIYTYDRFSTENPYLNQRKRNSSSHPRHTINRDHIQMPIVYSESSDAYNVNERLSEPTEEDLYKRRQIHSAQTLCHHLLGLSVVVEHLPRYYNQYPFYPFTCNALLRRDQLCWHVLNNHVDIAFNINGWLMQRCPLAQYGCPYYQMRLKPSLRSVRFMSEFSCYTSYYDRPKLSNESTPLETTCNSASHCNIPNHIELVDLPNELLMYLFHYLDNLSLNCIAKTCYRLRDIAFSLIDNFGVVFIVWCKKTYEDSGSSSWKEERKVRFFTVSTSPIRQWQYSKVPHIGQHMSTCPFFHRSKLTKPVKLVIAAK